MRLVDVPDYLYEEPFGFHEAYEGLESDFYEPEEGSPEEIEALALESFQVSDYEVDLDSLEMNLPKGEWLTMRPAIERVVKGLEDGLLGPTSLRQFLIMADRASTPEGERLSTAEEISEMFRILIFFMEKWQKKIAEVLARPDSRTRSTNRVIVPLTKNSPLFFSARKAAEGRLPFGRHLGENERWYTAYGAPQEKSMKFSRAPVLMPFEIVSVPDHPNLAEETYYPIEELEQITHMGPITRSFVCLAESHARVPNLSVMMRVFTKEDFPMKGRIEAVTDAMHGCATLHAEGRVHRDIKPANIFCTRNKDLDCANWALGDHELVINSGHSVTAVVEEDENGRVIIKFLFHGTKGYLDAMWFKGLKNDSYKYTPATDVFAFGVTLLSLYYAADGLKLRKILEVFFQKIDVDTPEEEIMEFLEELFLEEKPKFPVPENVQMQLAKMLMYMPENRCSLKEVIETLEDEYEMV